MALQFSGSFANRLEMLRHIELQDATVSELEAKMRLLHEKDAVISGMSEQFAKAKECLATKQQVSRTLIVMKMTTML